MTPKEKAQELFLNMYTVELWTGNHLDKEAAKQCALIAVDEILSLLPLANRDFWQQVKNEIERM